MLNLERMIQLSVDIEAHIFSDYSDFTSTTMAETFIRLSEINIIPQDLAKT